MENIPTKNDLMESLQEELQAFNLKNQSDNAAYFNMDEIYDDLHKMKCDAKNMFGSIKHMSKRQCRIAAIEEVNKKISLRKNYMRPYTTGNIADKLGNIYKASLLDKLQTVKEKIVAWHEENSLPLPDSSFTVYSIDEIYFVINLKSHQQIESNVAEILAEYIDKKILPKRDYTKTIRADDLDVEYCESIDISNIGISPFEEITKKFLGTYTHWQYNLAAKSIDAMNDKVAELAKDCAEDFFQSGYLQDVITRLVEDLLQKLQAIEDGILFGEKADKTCENT